MENINEQLAKYTEEKIKEPYGFGVGPHWRVRGGEALFYMFLLEKIEQLQDQVHELKKKNR